MEVEALDKETQCPICNQLNQKIYHVTIAKKILCINFVPNAIR